MLSNQLIVTPDLNFLTNILPLILPMNFSERLEQWCMHNGNPAHFAFNVRKHLNNTLIERWFGRSEPVP